MPARRYKKVKKYRGSQTHGGGSKKKRRGAGNRGGRGMAGSGKRADQKKPTIFKLYGSSYFGKKGFTSKSRTPIQHTINIYQLDKKIDSLVSRGLAEARQGVYHIDLKKINVQKLLGAGAPARRYNIAVAHVSKGAKKKIEEKGGAVNAES